MNKPPSGPDFFNKDAALKYDERNSKLNRISDCMHFLTGLALRDLPAKSKVLCVGAGTGAEILPLAQNFPEWTFVALEPSLDMLNVCRERMTAAGLAVRIEFVHGYVHDLPRKQEFDAVLSILVGHFVPHAEKADFFKHMSDHLKVGGCFVNAEISFDLASTEFPTMLKGWEGVQTLMGATPESLATLPTILKDILSVKSPAENEALIKKSGIALPVRFFQAMMICAWYGKK